MMQKYAIVLDVDDCKDVKCLNGGTCVDEVNGFKCLCVAGWEGLHCESGKFSFFAVSFP